MMDAFTQVVVWLDAAADAVGRWLLAPIAWAPEWLSATAVAAFTGLLMLVVYKYTSNQRAIKRVRDDISANLLTLKLFKDNTSAVLKAQRRLLVGAGWMLLLALVPMAVLLVPVTLLLGQLSLWYDGRPLPVPQEAVVITMRLDGGVDDPYPARSLQPSKDVEATVRPVRVRKEGRRELWWNVQAEEAGNHRLVFVVGGQQVEKELAVGDGAKRVSTMRPGWNWWDALTHPSETPFGPDSAVQSIKVEPKVEYPQRDAPTAAGGSWATCWYSWAMTGAGWIGYWIGLPAWMIYWFVVSLVVGLCLSRVLKVNV
jgi:hypothetical protein